jgi:arylsulfatase A-like enzyme
LCSPTRSTFLTGRNHHLNGFATISESSTGFPGYSSHIPPENATMATVLRDAGWSTYWVGKNHNVPVDEWSMGASKKNWPLGQGYDRFYGFIGGETNNWYPDLAEDNHYTDQPYLPEGTELTPINPMPPGTFTKGDAVRPWDSLSDEEKRLFSRMAEVYAGFSEYTDAQVGRIIDYLEESGQLENTIVFYCADNGASGEGSPNGSVNEGKVFGGYPDDLQQNLAMVDQLGTPDTYNHYPTGWAVAFSTPYRMFKRYTYQGGVCDPLVIHWPAGIKARGEVRHQYHHSTDIVPTILEVCGVEMPEVVNGATQTPLSGVSMRYSFDADPDGPTEKQTQYYKMLGSRGIWHQGWKAVAEHGPTSGMSNFDRDRWQLFHTDEDRSEAHDLAEEHPRSSRSSRRSGWRRPRRTTCSR